MSNSYPPFNAEKLTVSNQLVAIVIESDPSQSPITSDYIRVHSVEGQESISQPFQLTIELRADDTTEAGVRLDGTMIGRWVKLRIAMPEVSQYEPRYFRGIITEIALGAPGIYTLTVQSPLHLLSLRNNYYIYSNCDIRNLILQLFEQELIDPRFTIRFNFSNSPTLTRTQDWMQAGETHLDMLQRILGKAFINYFFIHEKDQLTLVFSDKTTTPDTVVIPGYKQGPVPLRYTFTSVEPLRSLQYDAFAELRYSMKMMPGKVNTMLNQVDPQWKDNTVATYKSYQAHSEDQSALQFHHHWNYDYGVNDAEAKDQTLKIRQQIATEEGTLTGNVYTPLLSPGYCFELSNPLLDIDTVEGTGRPEFDGEIYVVTKIQHKISNETGYTGSVEATSVSTSAQAQAQTYLTPFSIQNTQQGSVLAKVLDHAMPVGWRYRSKNNFQPEKGQVFFEGGLQFTGECHGEAGCLVELATGQRHWVVLPRSSQSVPEINSLVMIGRGSGESEQPELQQVLASHGSKVIQPPDRRNASWQANTNWGSSYSTSYGDSISIHYGHNAQTDLKRAVRLVEGAYDNVGMQGTNYGSCSYNKGGSWSVSLSGNQANPDVGVIGASISQGSNYSQSHTAHSYSYGSVNVSEGYSETGKSASVSIIGKYTANPDLDSPSFINGKLPKDISEYTDELGSGDTFSRSSVLGRSISCNGVGVMAPDVSIGSILPGSNYSSSLTLGMSENWSKTIGVTFSDSLMVGMSISNNVTLAAQLSNSLTVGAIASVDTRIAGVTSLSTTIGPNTSSSLQIANNTSNALTIGNNTNVQTNLSNNTNISTTIANNTDLSTYIGNKTSTNAFIGNTADTSLNVSSRTSNSVAIGPSIDTSVNLAVKKSTNVFVGATDDTSINVAARNSTNISVGTSNDTSISVAANTSNNIAVAAKTDTSINIGSSTAMSVNLSSSTTMENSISSSLTMKNCISDSIEMINSLSTSMEIINQASACVKVVNGAVQAESDVKTYAKMRATTAEIISGIESKL